MKQNAGFTLVEIMIVVCIIGLLAVIAVPSFVRARERSQRNVCINNLRVIDGAVAQWAIEHNKNTGDPVDLVEPLLYIGRDPKCPSGGTYGVSVVGASPVCSFGAELDHVL